MNSVILFVMYSSHFINRAKHVGSIQLKTAIFIAVFLCLSDSYAQEYNNWLLSGNTILNFDTSPATIICSGDESEEFGFHNYTVALSDDNGKMILSGCLERDDNSEIVYVIKNANNQDLVRINNADPQNAIACKIPQGGYYIALVYRTRLDKPRELHIYKFGQNANLENEYIFKDSDYSFFIDFVRLEDCIVLIAYRKNQIETYKLTSDGCIMWKTSEMLLDKFLNKLISSCDIDHSIDNTKIIASTYGVAYVLNFDKNYGDVTIAQRFENDIYKTMAFSPTDKYFLTIDDEQLKGFKYDNDFDYVLDNPDIIYNLPKDNNVVCNQCWEMAVGVDGKLYLHSQYYDNILVLDGIESGNITETIIQSDCLKRTYFPRIPRMIPPNKCKISAIFDNATVCYGEPLKVILSGTAPYEVSYTLNSETKSFKTNNTEYQIDNIPGSYKLTKITDSKGCEIEPDNNNSAEILPKLLKLTITHESN